MFAYDFDWGAVFANRDLLLTALRNTLWIAVVSMVLAVAFGLVLALARTSTFKPFVFVASLYINIIRGIPLLVLIFYVYFGVSLWLGINFSNFQAGVISLTVFHTAFMAEIFRSGLQAVPKGQREAALSLGMNSPRAFLTIKLPQAIRVAIPTGGNDFVGMVKDTSLIGVIGIFELYRTGQKLVSDTFLPFEVWTGIAILYVAIVFAIDVMVRVGERLLRPGQRTRGPLASRKAAAIATLTDRIKATATDPPPGVLVAGLAPPAPFSSTAGTFSAPNQEGSQP